MRFYKHLRILAIVTTAWGLFWMVGLPDYYQQYSTRFMVVFDIVIFPPIWLIIYLSAKRSKPGRGIIATVWLTFYITVPLFVYDLIYCGFYLGHGLSFITKYWYIAVYYVVPWIAFPPTGWWVEKRRKFAV